MSYITRHLQYTPQALFFIVVNSWPLSRHPGRENCLSVRKLNAGYQSIIMLCWTWVCVVLAESTSTESDVSGLRTRSSSRTWRATASIRRYWTRNCAFFKTKNHRRKFYTPYSEYEWLDFHYHGGLPCIMGRSGSMVSSVPCLARS